MGKLYCGNGYGDSDGLNGFFTVVIETILNFNGDFDGHSDCEVTCKQSLNIKVYMCIKVQYCVNSDGHFHRKKGSTRPHCTF